MTALPVPETLSKPLTLVNFASKRSDLGDGVRGNGL